MHPNYPVPYHRHIIDPSAKLVINGFTADTATGQTDIAGAPGEADDMNHLIELMVCYGATEAQIEEDTDSGVATYAYTLTFTANPVN